MGETIRFPRTESLPHSARNEKQKKPVADIRFDSHDGIVYWQAVYEDGTVSGEEQTPFGVSAGSTVRENWKKTKLAELQAENRDSQVA